MVSELDKNTIEYVGKIQGKISYDETKPIIISDLDARLIKVLGNDNDLKNAGASDGLVVGATFHVSGNSFKIVKVKNDSLTGFNVAIIQRITEGTNPQVLETILWADGSKGFNNIFNSANPLEFLKTLNELNNDWVINDLLGIGSGSIFPQLQQLKDFAEEFGLSNIDVGIGQSLMGIGMSALAVTKGFQNIEFRTYSGCLTKDLYEKIKSAEGWGINSLNGANLKSYYTPGEPLLNIIEPYKGNNKFYMKEYTDKLGFAAHSAEAYNNKEGYSNYYEISQFHAQKFRLWEVNPRFEFTRSNTGTGYQLLIKFSPDTLNKLFNMSNVSRDMKLLLEDLGINAHIKVTDDINTYSIYDKNIILDKYEITNIELDTANPWLEDRYSDDKSFALIKPSEQIRIPQNKLHSTNISDMYRDIDGRLKGEYMNPDIPIPDDANFSLPSSGSSVDDSISYQFTSKPQMLSLNELAFIAFSNKDMNQFKKILDSMTKQQAADFLNNIFNPRLMRDLAAVANHNLNLNNINPNIVYDRYNPPFPNLIGGDKKLYVKPFTERIAA